MTETGPQFGEGVMHGSCIWKAPSDAAFSGRGEASSGSRKVRCGMFGTWQVRQSMKSQGSYNLEDMFWKERSKNPFIRLIESGKTVAVFEHTAKLL